MYKHPCVKQRCFNVFSWPVLHHQQLSWCRFYRKKTKELFKSCCRQRLCVFFCLFFFYVYMRISLINCSGCKSVSSRINVDYWYWHVAATDTLTNWLPGGFRLAGSRNQTAEQQVKFCSISAVTGSLAVFSLHISVQQCRRPRLISCKQLNVICRSK